MLILPNLPFIDLNLSKLISQVINLTTLLLNNFSLISLIFLFSLSLLICLILISFLGVIILAKLSFIGLIFVLLALHGLLGVINLTLLHLTGFPLVRLSFFSLKIIGDLF